MKDKTVIHWRTRKWLRPQSSCGPHSFIEGQVGTHCFETKEGKRRSFTESSLTIGSCDRMITFDIGNTEEDKRLLLTLAKEFTAAAEAIDVSQQLQKDWDRS